MHIQYRDGSAGKKGGITNKVCRHYPLALRKGFYLMCVKENTEERYDCVAD